MKSLSIAGNKNDLTSAFERALALDPSVLILFADPALLRDPEAWKLIQEKRAGKTLLGCSSAGEISTEGSSESGFSLLALHFDGTPLRVLSRPLLSASDSFDAGAALAEELKTKDLKAVFVLAPGTNVNGSGVADGLHATLGPSVIVSGGLAADGMAFKETHTFLNETLASDQIVALGLYGDRVVVSCGCEGGWRPFGPARRVTKAAGHILQELDGKPALQLYKQYLGDKARQLPASGLSYPFAILRDDRTMSGVIRSALGIDLEHESLVMAGDMPQGCQVCLMHADTGALIQGAAQAAAEALRTHAGSEENGVALLINCIGRHIVLGIDADEEIEAVVDSFLPGTTLAGCYCYGEISTHNKTGDVELHNQTMTITYITEREAAG